MTMSIIKYQALNLISHSIIIKIYRVAKGERIGMDPYYQGIIDRMLKNDLAAPQAFIIKNIILTHDNN